MLAQTPVEFNYLEILAKTFIIPANCNQFIQKYIFNKASVRRTANAMNTNSTFNASYTKNPIWYQQFDLGQIRILRGGQPLVDFDAANNCRLYVTTMKTISFQDDIPSIPIDNFKDHYVLVFDLTSMQDATENCHYPELVGEPLRLELNFSFLVEHVTELIVLWERMSPVAVDQFGVVEKIISNGECFPQALIQSYLATQVSVFLFISHWLCSNSFKWDFFSILNTQLSKMQGDHWIMIANCRQILSLQKPSDVKSTGSSRSTTKRWCQNHYGPIPAFGVCSTIWATFHYIKFRQEEINWIYDVTVPSCTRYYM